MFTNIAATVACLLAGATLYAALDASPPLVSPAGPSASAAAPVSESGSSTERSVDVATTPVRPDPRPDSVAPAAAAREFDVAALVARIDGLERAHAHLLDALEALRQRETGVDDLDEFEREDLVAAVEAELATEQAEANALAEEAELDALRAFEMESATRWGDATTRWLHAVLGSGSQLAVECRSTICSATFEGDDPDGEAEFQIALVELFARDDAPVVPMLSTVDEDGVMSHLFERRSTLP